MNLKWLNTIMVEALREVTRIGTAKSMSTIPQPTAGKTGTTNRFSDAWFLGFTPKITAGVWIGGKDKTESLGNRQTGGTVALPAFKYFISEFYRNKPPEP